MKLLTLSCPECGAVLKKQTNACEYCGALFFFTDEDAEGRQRSGYLPVSLGLRSDLHIQGGYTENVSITSHVSFIPSRLTIADPATRMYFNVEDVWLEGASIFDAQGFFSGEAFAPNHPHFPRIRPVVCSAGETLTVVVTQMAACSSRFFGEIYGQRIPTS